MELINAVQAANGGLRTLDKLNLKDSEKRYVLNMAGKLLQVAAEHYQCVRDEDPEITSQVIPAIFAVAYDTSCHE